VDEATFLRDAPPQFLEGIEDEHQMQMQRLRYEKYQRQELVRNCPPPSEHTHTSRVKDNQKY